MVGAEIVAVTHYWKVAASRKGHRMAENLRVTRWQGLGGARSSYDGQAGKMVMAGWRRNRRKKG